MGRRCCAHTLGLAASSTASLHQAVLITSTFAMHALWNRYCSMYCRSPNADSQLGHVHVLRTELAWVILYLGLKCSALSRQCGRSWGVAGLQALLLHLLQAGFQSVVLRGQQAEGTEPAAGLELIIRIQEATCLHWHAFSVSASMLSGWSHPPRLECMVIQSGRTMRFGSATKVPAKCIFKYHRISECG